MAEMKRWSSSTLGEAAGMSGTIHGGGGLLVLVYMVFIVIFLSFVLSHECRVILFSSHFIMVVECSDVDDPGDYLCLTVEHQDGSLSPRPGLNNFQVKAVTQMSQAVFFSFSTLHTCAHWLELGLIISTLCFTS